MKGVIQSYNQKKHIGVIFSEGLRYWYHRDRIRKGPLDPTVGSEVVFDVSPSPVPIGRMPVATNIVVHDSSPADLLAGGVA